MGRGGIRGKPLTHFFGNTDIHVVPGQKQIAELVVYRFGRRRFCRRRLGGRATYANQKSVQSLLVASVHGHRAHALPSTRDSRSSRLSIWRWRNADIARLASGYGAIALPNE